MTLLLILLIMWLEHVVSQQYNIFFNKCMYDSETKMECTRYTAALSLLDARTLCLI